MAMVTVKLCWFHIPSLLPLIPTCPDGERFCTVPIATLTLMLLVANLAIKMTEGLAHGYSSESTQQELSNEYQHDKV